MQPELFDNLQDDQRLVHNPIIAEDGIKTQQDPIALSIPDDELIKNTTKWIKDSKKFWENKYNLQSRRKKMENALFGREITEREKANELKKYETRYSNNATYEIEATLKPVAMSKLPDMIIAPGTETPESKESAENLSQAINNDIQKRDIRRVLGLAFKHLPVYFTGIIKVIWNPELGEHGDLQFVNVHPDNVIIDMSAISNQTQDMKVIPELLTLTVQDLVMRFPNKKDELFKRLKADGLAFGEDGFSWKDLASEVKIWEVWFTWYKREDTGEESLTPTDEASAKWERIEGVLWKYGEGDDGIILKKMKNPNFDYEGEVKLFTYQDPSDENSKQEVGMDQLLTGAVMGQEIPNVVPEQTYFNYFKAPQKPYFFFGYDQWGKVAMDETSRIEQNLYNQNNLNSLGKQIWDTMKTRVKHIWSTDSGMKADDVQQMDLEDPKLDALVDGNINDVHKAIQPERPDQAQFQALTMAKQDMFGLAGATALTGVLQSDTATSNQIAREENFTRADDLVDDTINAASEWMSGWILQMIKLRYTEEHWRKMLGSKGSVTFLKLKRDMVEDGQEVMIKSSGTDKLKAQRNAMDAAKLGAPFVNPLDFFQDMEYSDPEGRTERGMLFATDPQAYLVKYGMGLQTPEQQVQALGALSMAGAPGAAPQPGQPAASPPPAGNPSQPAPMSPSPQDTSAIPTLPQGSPRGI